MSFQKIPNKYQTISFSETDKGYRFEWLIKTNLLPETKNAYKFKIIWLWNEFPGKLDLVEEDTGIDLVAGIHEGDYWELPLVKEQRYIRMSI